MNTINTRSLHPGDIVSFHFPHREGDAPYPRPCLVMETTEDEVVLAYGTTSKEKANAGCEIRLNADFADCGLQRATRFVLARRLRVAMNDPRLAPRASDGSPVIGRLTSGLHCRLQDLRNLISASWPNAALRQQAERHGIHPQRQPRRGRGRGMGADRL